jgi:hypothetical protein
MPITWIFRERGICNFLTSYTGAEAIQNNMDASWGVDAEGEVRGLWKRHQKVDNFWIFAGGAAQHRYYSKVIALQIKGALEGILHEAYRDLPTNM